MPLQPAAQVADESFRGRLEFQRVVGLGIDDLLVRRREFLHEAARPVVADERSSDASSISTGTCTNCGQKRRNSRRGATLSIKSRAVA